MASPRPALSVVPTTEHPGDRWNSPEPPLRIARPMLFQAWRDCAFIHWPFEPAEIRPLVPRGFELETFEGRAWASVIPFRIPRMRPGGLPRVPGLDSGLETHIRTYVRGPDGRAGIWMLTLDFAPLAGALLGRFGFALPYWWAGMEVRSSTNRISYRSKRRFGPDARFALDLTVGDEVPNERAEALDHYLTARWVLYSGIGPLRAAILTEHPRWQFREVAVERLDQTLLRAVGLPEPRQPPLVHFSDGVDARLSWPHPFVSRSHG